MPEELGHVDFVEKVWKLGSDAPCSKSTADILELQLDSRSHNEP
jgi:hypothetical protein